LILDGSDEVVAGFPDTGKSTGGRMDNISTTSSVYGGGKGLGQDLDADDVRGDPGYGDEGSAARFFKSVTFDDDDVQSFFYCAKASTSERDAGLEGLAEIRHSDRKSAEGVGGDNPRNRTNEAKRNFHPTIKPLALMRYLIKLVTPPGGVVLDPFLGSGTTAVAAILDGFDWIGCEMTEEYWPIIEARVAWAEEARLRTPPSLFDVSDVEQPSKPVKPTRPVTPPPSSLFDVLADAHVS
jgi:site-specific DNA-methyltransferase (adenine-specific)